MSLCDFITFLQRVLTSTNQQKNDLLQTMTIYTKRDTNERQDTNANQSRTHHPCRAAILIYIWAKFLLHIMRVYRGQFQTGDNARVYMWQNFRSA